MPNPSLESRRSAFTIIVVLVTVVVGSYLVLHGYNVRSRHTLEYALETNRLIFERSLEGPDLEAFGRARFREFKHEGDVMINIGAGLIGLAGFICIAKLVKKKLRKRAQTSQAKHAAASA